MPIYKPSELMSFLEGLGIHPKKILSQNFLLDGNIIHKIISTAKVVPGDFVVEIGPGPGALTELLLKTGASVLAIEKDGILGEALKRFSTSYPSLEVVIADILEYPLEKELLKRLHKGQKAKVIANLPYHITTPIVARLIELQSCISELVVMVQEEMARRFVGKPGTSDYSSLTILLNFHSRPSYAFKVSRNCFYPAPKVDSAVVKLELTAPLHVSNVGLFFQMIREAFKHRRKMLRSSLRDLYAPAHIEEALNTMGKSQMSRPEELSVNELISLFEILARFNSL
jgi:16S rRNA (adenine1518-N6/adenine1519-N6)-dimethyltransferase